MYKEHFSNIELRTLYPKSRPLYSNAKYSTHHTREVSPNEQSKENYRLPEFASYNYKATDRPRHKRNHQANSLEIHKSDIKPKNRFTERKEERDTKNYNYRFSNLQNSLEITRQPNKQLKKDNFKRQIKQIVIDQEEIFSFREIVDPEVKENKFLSTRTAVTNQSSPVSKNVMDFKKHSVSFWDSFSSQNKMKNHLLQKKKPTQKDFTAIKFLGKGKYSKSYLVREKNLNFICVLKQINKETIKKQKMMERVLLQIKIHSCIKHPNIIQMYGFFQTETDICLILQYGQEGRLTKVLKHREISQNLIFNCAYDISMAVEYLHSRKIIHRDIKPDNVLMSNGVVKIFDFSWATIIPSKRSTFGGSFGYTPPKVSQLNKYNQSIDTWGLGVVLYELATGKQWISSFQESINYKTAKDKIQLPHRLSSDLKDLINGLLKSNPIQRLTLSQVFRHPFMKKHNKL